jgi:FkbM family methyltransferase
MYKPTTSCGEIGLILHEIYQIVLGYKANGVFVEVGANDGKTGSFTYNLANTGWKGLYIEPVPRIYQECKKNHENNDVIVLNMGCAENKGNVVIADGGTLSTMDAEMFNLYKKMKWTRNNFRNSYSTNVTVDKLDNILNKYSFKSDFDVFVLDVEGYEEKVLNGFSLNEFKPKIVIVEIPDQFEDYIDNKNLMDKFKKIRSIFTNNYTLLVNDVVDNVYIRNDLITKENKNKLKDCVKNIKYPQFI